MSATARLAVLALAFCVLAPAFWRLAIAIPPFGDAVSPYGAAVNAIVPAARHVSNMVAAVNFDVRGFDTLGEECMLLCAVTGAVVLLRGSRGEGAAETAGRVPGRPTLERSDATVALCRLAALVVVLFGIYMALHGTATPGGGFQGGAIAASGLLLVYLGEGYEGWRAVVRSPLLDLAEGGGAFAFVAAAALPLAAGSATLENILPLGTAKDMFSGGLMVVANFAVAVSVFGSFALLFLEFMEETRASETDDVPDEADR